MQKAALKTDVDDVFGAAMWKSMIEASQKEIEK
jgi:hypothetical protein